MAYIYELYAMLKRTARTWFKSRREKWNTEVIYTQEN